MNVDRKEKRIYLEVLLGCLLCIFLTGVFYVITFRRPTVLGLEVFSRANGTRTAIALTSRALYGPFPTVTGPTPTITKTRTVTPSPTVTASITPSPTPLRFFINTPTPRTPNPDSGTNLIPGSTVVSNPTNPPARPTQPPAQATQPPPQPTQPPPQATRKACVNPQGHPIPCH